MSRTTREINYRLKAMNKRWESENRFDAAIHGIKLEDKSEEVEVSELSKEDEEAMMRAMKEAQQRKIAQIGARNGRL